MGNIMADTENRTFEAALQELEDHVRRLDSGELPLEESLQTFESGVKLVRECSELLDGAEQRITELTETPLEGEAKS
jgi:exodeoxyribonuclease VII small subunit